ncbi:MAG: M23 family metallopeptidase [Pseudomonadota bacterium]
MRIIRALLVMSSTITWAAGCATAPPPTSTGYSSSLSLCKTRVSNAPQVDRRGRIANFQATTRVRGVVLARAPVDGCLSSGFGRRFGGAGSIHKGIDLYTGQARDIIAAGPGRVVQIGRQSGFGRTILIEHRNGVATRYAHLSSYAPRLKSGDRVAAGTVIGRTGASGNATGVHLHYEILVNGRAIDPLR